MVSENFKFKYLKVTRKLKPEIWKGRGFPDDSATWFKVVKTTASIEKVTQRWNSGVGEKVYEFTLQPMPKEELILWLLADNEVIVSGV
jgi:hypothetical protein